MFNIYNLFDVKWKEEAIVEECTITEQQSIEELSIPVS